MAGEQLPDSRYPMSRKLGDVSASLSWKATALQAISVFVASKCSISHSNSVLVFAGKISALVAWLFGGRGSTTPYALAPVVQFGL